MHTGIMKKIMTMLLCLVMVFMFTLKPLTIQAEASGTLALTATAGVIIAAIIAMLGYKAVNDTDTQVVVNAVGVHLPDVMKQAINSVPPPTGNNINIRDLILTAGFASIVYEIYNFLQSDEIVEQSQVLDISEYVYQGEVYQFDSSYPSNTILTSLTVPNFQYVFSYPDTVSIVVDDNGTVAYSNISGTRVTIGIQQKGLSVSLSGGTETKPTRYWLGIVEIGGENYIQWIYKRYEYPEIYTMTRSTSSVIAVNTETQQELIPVIIEPGVLTPGSVVTALEDAAATAQEQGTGVNVSTETEWNDLTQEQALDDIGALPYLDPETEPILDDYSSPGLKDVFPFCIPFDIYAMVTGLAAAREAPEIEIDWHIPIVNIDFQYVASLAQFDTAATILRSCELILFCVGLAILTGKVIRW